MESKRTATTYFIPPGKFLLMENALGNPDLIQSSVSSDCRVTIVDSANFPLDELEQWPTFRLTSADIKLKLGDGAYYIYIVVPTPDNTESTSAFISYNTALVDREGYEVLKVTGADGKETTTKGELLGKVGFKYYQCGTITERGGNPSVMTTPSGQGRLIEMDLGVTPSPSTLPGGLNDFVEIFQIDKVDPNNINSWLLTILATIKSMVVRILRITGSIIFGEGENERAITGVAIASDKSDESKISDTILASTAWVDAQFDALDDKYLRKDQDDRTPYKLNVGDKLTAEKGVQIGESFIPGILTGSGGYFDEYANGEVESLIIRRFLEVPELRFNRVQVTLGDKWNAPGAGVIERVVSDSDTTGTIFLKLEEGEYGAIAVGDICMGIFHSEDSSMNATDDDEVYGTTDDGKTCLSGFQFAGFYTCYFTITSITGKNNGQFTYQLRAADSRWKLQYHPNESMHFVCYGSFTNKDRQTSAYTTRTYTRLLHKQNSWDITIDNIAMQYGDLSNMNYHGLDMEGYSIFTNNIYNRGVIKQIKDNGDEILTAIDKGNWVSGTKYDYYDRVSHNGSLWLCMNSDGTNTEPKKGNSDWLLQVAAGDSLVVGGRFSSAKTPYSPNSILDFAGKLWSSTDTVDYAPYGIWTDKDGNRFQFNDGGFCLVDEETRSGWTLFVDLGDVTDGEDGKSLVVQYSKDGSNWHDIFQSGDVYMRQKLGEDGTWSDKMRIVGEAGAAGENGEYTDFEFAVNDSMDVAPLSGWQDAPPSVGRGQYLWMRQRVVHGDGTAENWSTPVRIGGEKGDSVEFVGHFQSGVAVPYLGVVSMGGSNWVSKVATTNPPLWTWEDKDGNRFIFSDGGYALTGEENEAEYELMVANGKDGKDGKDYEYIFINTTTEQQPSTPSSAQVDDYIPTGWTDDPTGVTESIPYEWVCKRTKKDGVWSEFSIPALWAKYGEKGQKGDKGETGSTGGQGIQGIQGCILRKSEWKEGVEYRNDEKEKSGTRYVDVVLVRNENATTGWDAYKCIETHPSTHLTKPPHSGLFEPFGLETTAIFTSLIIAKDASIDFMQGNELLIKGSDGVTVEAGLSGSSATGGDIRLWVGGETPDDAPFTVDKYGNVVATNATITGVIKGATIEGALIVGTGTYKAKINPSGDYPSITWGDDSKPYVWMGMNTPTGGYLSGQITLRNILSSSAIISPNAIQLTGDSNFGVEINASGYSSSYMSVTRYVAGSGSYRATFGIDSNNRIRLGASYWPTESSQVNVGEVYSDNGTLKIRRS